jgi:hypothetical protein
VGFFRSLPEIQNEAAALANEVSQSLKNYNSLPCCRTMGCSV